MSKQELIMEFCKLSEYDAFVVILELLKAGKLNYVQLSQAYVHFLKEKTDDMVELQAEAETCATQLIDAFELRGKAKRPAFLDAVRRTIYLLDITKRIPTKWLKDKYGYDEAEAKELSFYGRRNKYGK